ncbi:MAG: tRNA (N(6)-L-threonylcarbamoyladenosine(37)-C(2))-methylthiotransferase MtaB [Thermonema sp.]|uniref:tRNA (N(6)-L-threonylcarbamoyladenosine(37)-C(2))- methylthiotransferase MtaB n=1 Tax=Thermonema sp. TaxID=2231181 RepID=UPI0021DC8E24|nr:tRNA (N(6)-L-threonylcarbamoyladenosine(37)-C(2))-methylthiotransferase MtaB [Thermonema sp.]GIV39069.1 MAG: tRNA (N(6)-L-threonylcarbamoyladenosine(37)-C(2))-methylthiotransferase MtaB [Thermonema sp.]
MKRVALYTLGCKLNFSESSTIARQFEQKGYRVVPFTEQPDIFIINTCSVTDHADRKCRKVVKQALKISPHAFIAIIGCYAQLKPQEIAEIEGVDVVLGAAEKFRLLELIDTFEKKPQAEVYASPIEEVKTVFEHAYSYGDRTRTFLKVQDGCNYNCSFCTIPMARGKSRSPRIADIVEEARRIAATDVREVVLTGVNIGDFGIIDGRRQEHFIDLIKALDEVEGIGRYRISSIEPNLLTEEIIAFVAGSKRFAPHFHIPLQSGSNKILKQMYRRYQRELYADRVATIRRYMPHACIGVDVIVGFPGETEEDFLETYQFLNELEVSYLHVFPYSERANTPAASMPGRLPERERKRRADMLRILSEKKRRYFYEQQLGKQATVLFEEEVKAGKMIGFTEQYVRVEADYDPLLVNEFVPVVLDRINAQGHVEVEMPVHALSH